MATPSFEESPDYVQSLARGLQVLRAFDRDQPSQSLSQVAERAGLSRAVARRLLLTLQHLDYVGSRGRSFYLTPRVLELGYSFLSSLGLTELAQLSMEQLAQRVGQSCSMSVLDGHDIVYVLRVPVHRVMSMTMGVGARLPAFAASMGRVMLADLPSARFDAWARGNPFRAFTPHTLGSASALKAELVQVRKQGYAVVAQELELGLCTIAVPIRAGDGRVVAGLNVSLPFNDAAIERATLQILPALQSTQLAIEQAIKQGGWLPQLYMRHPYG